MENIKFYINNIRVSVITSQRKVWNELILHELERQIGKKHQKTVEVGYNIEVLDIEKAEVENIFKKSEIAPKTFAFKTDSERIFLYDFKKNALLIVKEKSLRLYTDKKLAYPISYLVNLLLVAEGRSFVHSAAFSCKGRAYLFCGFGGVGKTALVAEASKQGFKILGDDLNILDGKGNIYPYHRPLCIYKYHKQLFPDYFEEFPTPILQPTVLNRIRRKAKAKLGIPDFSDYNYATIPPSSILGERNLKTGPAKLKDVFILTRKNDIEKVFSEKCDHKYAVNFALSVIHSEFYRFYRHLFSYFAFTGKFLDKYIDRQRSVIDNSFSSVQTKKILVPSRKNVKEVGHMILNHLGMV